MTHSRAFSETFDSLIKDVQNLITLWPGEEGSRGRPAGDTGPLLRSTVVLLHTAWENYVEQVSLEGLEFILVETGDDHNKLPRAMKRKLGEGKDPWALAGSGWKTKARETLAREAGNLNTPNVSNSEKLIELATGAEGALHLVSWRNMGNDKVVKEIDAFVRDIRGEIVHKGKTPGPLHKSGVLSWINFFVTLVEKLDNRVAEDMTQRFGKSPW
ncbi:HEPN domain-containing protein [Clavibacter sp. CFBP 8614]|uniref:HEPN domain-containing protein n=1 Tax=unclassified Clavibacter TaxID=2626594 RepID=UPI004040F8B3